MLCRSLERNYLTGALGKLFQNFIKTPRYEDKRVATEKGCRDKIGWMTRYGKFAPQNCPQGEFRTAYNASTLGECKKCKEPDEAIGPDFARCARPAAEAAIKRKHLQEYVYKHSSDLGPQGPRVEHLVISLKPRSCAFDFSWQLKLDQSPEVLPRSISLDSTSSLNSTSGEYIVNAPNKGIPIYFDPSGLNGLNESDVITTNITISGMTHEKDKPVNISKLEVTINVRAMPSIRKSKFSLLIDGSEVDRESFVQMGSLIELTIDAVDEDNRAISGVSKFWFVAEVQQLGSNKSFTCDVRYSDRNRRFHATLLSRSRVGQYKVWISKIRTDKEEFDVIPAIRAGCGLPTNTSEGCPPLAITVMPAANSRCADVD